MQVTQIMYLGEHNISEAREWVLSFRNTGSAPSPPLCNVTALDTTLNRLGISPFVHRFVGSHASAMDYFPLVYPVPAAGSASIPVPGLPHQQKRLVHGQNSTNNMEINQRLWCHQDCSKGMRHSTFYSPTASSCQIACAGNATCMGATWVHASKECYMLASLDSTDSETGYSSWSRVPVVDKPHDAYTPTVGPTFAPQGGRSSDGVLPYFAVYGADSGWVYSVGWSGGWEAAVHHNNTTSQHVGTDDTVVNVQIRHITGSGSLCTSLTPGEAIRGMRIVSVPFSKGESHSSTSRDSDNQAAYGGLSANVSVRYDSRRNFAENLTRIKNNGMPMGVAPGGYRGLGFGHAQDAPGTYPQIGFNKHRRLLSYFKLPRNRESGAVRGAAIASWAWIGWTGKQSEQYQHWHASVVKNTTVEYYWLDAGWFNGGFPNVS